MVRLALHPAHPRASRALLVSLIVSGALLSSCQREERPDLTSELNRLKADLEATNRKLRDMEKNLDSKSDELELATATIESSKHQLAERVQAATERDTQLCALQSEMETLKKRDGFVFAEIRALQQQGQSAIALSRYQKFIQDFPSSPLAANAANAIAELSGSQREARTQAVLADPRRGDRELMKLFGEGFSTPAELAPLLKKKSRAQVLALFGPPNQTFQDGSDLGYADKATDPATGKKGMLIISFESGKVSALRLEYSGRKITP